MKQFGVIKMFRKFLIATVATAALAAMTGQANAHSIGIGDSVSGNSGTVYLSSYHSSAGLEGGINLMGPGQGGGGTNYAFDTDYPGGGAPAGFTVYDAGPFYANAVNDWQSVTVGGLAGGLYTYVFTNAVGGGISADYSPHGGSYAKYTGQFRISAIPLPAALPLYAAGMAVLGFLGWRRKQRNHTA